MKQKFLVKILTFLLILSICLLTFGFQQANEERILFFGSAISILEDGSLRIQETIVVECLNININHGIYRDLPLYDNVKSFFPKSLDLNILEGKMDGNPAIAKTEKYPSFLRVYLGDSQNIISKGIHTFEISYTYKNIIKKTDDAEILYLNITGNDWDFPILKSAATIIFPEALLKKPDFKFNILEAYTGIKGQTDKDYTITTDKQKPNIIYIETNKVLNRNEGLTVFIKWTPIFFNSIYGFSNSSINFAFDLIKSNPTFFILFFGCIIILLYYFIIWAIFGKDPKKMKIPPSANVIEKLSPASIRYLYKMGFDTKCLTTAIISMASKGYCTLNFEDNGFSVKKSNKNSESDITLSSEEIIIANKIFSEGNESFAISKANYTTLASLLKKVKEDLQMNYKNIYFVTNSIYFIIGLLVSIVIFIISLLSDRVDFQNNFILIWLTIWTAATFGLVSAARQAFKGKKFGNIGAAMTLMLFSIIFIIVEIFVIAIAVSGSNIYLMLTKVLAIIFLITINSIYFKLLKRPTKEGTPIYEEIEALRRYLIEISKNFKSKNDNADFENDKLIAYAFALDLEQDLFSTIFTSSDTAYSNDTYSTNTYSSVNPDRTFYTHSGIPWIVMGSHSNFSDIRYFLYSLNSSIASNSTSSSSSSSGGGSSGGGSGGGGGGGW